MINDLIISTLTASVYIEFLVCLNKYISGGLTLISFLERLVFFTRKAISSLESCRPLSDLLSLAPMLGLAVVWLRSGWEVGQAQVS